MHAFNLYTPKIYIYQTYINPHTCIQFTRKYKNRYTNKEALYKMKANCTP